MQELGARNFWWHGYPEEVATYVAGCDECHRAKADRHSKAKALLPMPLGIRPWEEIAVDFVGELPESDGFNAILVITDRFTKMQQYIPAKTTWTSDFFANVYITDIWRHYGLQSSHIRPQFTRSRSYHQCLQCIDLSPAKSRCAIQRQPRPQ